MFIYCEMKEKSGLICSAPTSNSGLYLLCQVFHFTQAAIKDKFPSILAVNCVSVMDNDVASHGTMPIAACAGVYGNFIESIQYLFPTKRTSAFVHHEGHAIGTDHGLRMAVEDRIQASPETEQNEEQSNQKEDNPEDGENDPEGRVW
jgi:hypothetical protein